MIDKLARAGAWLIAIIMAVFWLRNDAKADAKAKAKSDQKDKVLDNVQKAVKASKRVNADSDAVRRERLRKRNK